MAARNSHYTSMMGPPAGMPQPMSMYGGQDYRTSRALSHAGDLQAPAGTDYFGNRPGSTASHYSAAGGAPHPQSQYMAPGFDSGLPTNDEILCELRNILATANLMTITKKQVRERLNEHFHCDLLVRKDFINSSIEMILQDKR
ncbi:hypothetical protein H4R35_007222 [Dimargaris xerosporica]|nr:hypothetical protein H4R35_007222 [Dimargaris xerosporica]